MSFHLFIRNVSCASCSACRKDFVSGKRVRPKGKGFCRLPHQKWRLGYEIGFLLFGFFGNSSPSLVQTDGLFAGDADDGTMARMEVFDEGFGLGTEMNKVLAALEFITSAAVKVVHQDVFVRIVQFEYAGAFHVRTSSGIRVEICEMLFPRAAQRRGRGLLYAAFQLFAVPVFGVSFIKEMIGAVFMDDVAVYGTVFGSEHQLRLVLEGREIFVGVCAIEIEGGVVFEAYGEVDQVFPCFGGVNGLGCPHPFDVGELLGIGFFQVDDAVCPIGQVAGFEQDDAGIVFPTVLSGEHVCGRDIKAVPVFSAQDVRVAYASGLGYFVRWDDGAVPVQGFPVYGIRTHGKSQLFLCRQFARTFKVSKQIGGVVRRFL